ncbi:MAG: type II toxin-antitoxin system Phd/YefM family antitoxin [Clostridiaceae bacterium]|nr:type II toxin-antitoxin system Phd/YefM family antitoxin [Clostridiaceae bacterium]
MIVIRPISDLRNRFSEIEKVVKEGVPVYLTKNGYGSMVVMSLEQYAALTDNIETKLDEADRVAESSSERYRAEEIFQRANNRIAKNEGV